MRYQSVCEYDIRCGARGPFCTTRELADAVWAKMMGGRWIPVDERLPESGVFVLISSRIFPDPVVGSLYGKELLHVWASVGYGHLTESEVEAWMPLPAPYAPYVPLEREKYEE